MNKFLRTYLPAFSMAFTFIILYATISNIIAGYSKDRFCFFILQVFVYLMVSVIVDWLLSFIDFSKYIHHFIAEMIILYPITISYCQHKVSLSKHLMRFFYVCILSSVCVIFYIQNKKGCYSLKNNSLSYYISLLEFDHRHTECD